MNNVCYGHRRKKVKSRANDLVTRLGERLDGTLTSIDAPLPDDCDLYIQWGFKETKALLSALSNKVPYVIVDLGLWEDERVQRQSISINGLHGGGLYPAGVLDLPPRYHPPIQNWKSFGDNVLVCGQMPGDAALRGSNPETWMRRVAGLAVDHIGLPVKLRPHPKTLEPWERGSEPLSEALESAALVITYSSTVGITSLIAGVPTVAMSYGSSAWGMASKVVAIDTPPGRQAWAHKLSYHDYDLSNDRDADECADFLRMVYPEMAFTAADGEAEYPDNRGR